MPIRTAETHFRNEVSNLNDMLSGAQDAAQIKLHETAEPYNNGRRTVFRFGIARPKDATYRMLRQAAIRAAAKTSTITRVPVDFGLDILDAPHGGLPKTLEIRFLLEKQVITPTPKRPPNVE